jgi:hypothetical protein
VAAGIPRVGAVRAVRHGLAYLKLEERGVRSPAKIDWWGNITFAVRLIAVLVGITYGILPYGGHNMGWTAPRVIASLLGGFAMMGLFVVIERRVEAPFATGGMIASAIGFPLLIALPIDFTYWEFGLVIYLIGAAMGLFAAPNLTWIMNSLPPDQRGSGAGRPPPSRTRRPCCRSACSSA